MPAIAPLNIVFAGTPAFAAHHLHALINSPHKIISVYTQPDRPAGRGKKLTPSPVKLLAQTHNIPVMQPGSLKSPEAQTELAKLQPDLMVIVAYGLLLPKAVLTIPRLGCTNVHGSLLPRWRGAAPVQRAIEAGDFETGITIMQMDVGLDTGDMLAKATCPIDQTDTSLSLFSKLETIGPPLLMDTIERLSTKSLEPQKQDDALATYAHKIEKAEAEINWHLPARELDRKIRAFNPFPVAFTESNGERVKIYSAAVIPLSESNQPNPGTILQVDKQGIVVQCGENALCLLEIQLPGKKAMTPQAILAGRSDRFVVGNCFE